MIYKVQMLEEKAQSPKEEMCEIGTQILDAQLPSDIDFTKCPKGKGKPSEISENQLETFCSIGEFEEGIKSYNVKGNGIFNIEPTYSKGDLIEKQMPTFGVKVNDEQTSAGLRGWWETIVGYSLREIYLEDGHLYILEKVSGGLLVKGSCKLNNLVKIFLPSQKQVRLAFREEENQHRTYNKTFIFDDTNVFLHKLRHETSTIGIELLSDKV